jgi:hypothetical protein
MKLPEKIDFNLKGHAVTIDMTAWEISMVEQCIINTVAMRLREALRRSPAAFEATIAALNAGRWNAQMTGLQKAEHFVAQLTPQERAILLEKYYL